MTYIGHKAFPPPPVGTPLPVWDRALYGCPERDSVSVSPYLRTAVSGVVGGYMVSRKADPAAPLAAAFTVRMTRDMYRAFEAFVEDQLFGGAYSFRIPLYLWDHEVQAQARLSEPYTMRWLSFDTVEVAVSVEIERWSLTYDDTAPPPVPDTTPPVMPAGALTLSAPERRTVLAGWLPGTDNVRVQRYRLERREPGGQWLAVYVGAATSHTDTEVEDATLYEYRVSAFDPSGNQSNFENGQVTTQAAPPDTAPDFGTSTLTAVALSDSAIRLTWGPATDDVGVAGYMLDRLDGATWTRLHTGTVLTWDDTGRLASTLYQYRVRAFDAAGNISAALTAQATTQGAVDTTPPVWAPNALTLTTRALTAPLGAAITVQRVPATDNVGVTRYRIEYSLDGNAWTQFFDGVWNIGGVDVFPLAWSTLYHIRVTAFDAAGNSAAVQGTITTAANPNVDTIPPTIPTDALTYFPLPSGVDVRFAWFGATDNVAVTRYTLELKAGPAGQWQLIYDGASNTHTQYGLTAGVAYYARVYAFDAAGNKSPTAAELLFFVNQGGVQIQ